jgi:hypothetical protein
MLFLAFALLLASAAMAGEQKAMILKLNYDLGNITLVDKTLKYGFSPDRRHQPYIGYTAEVIYRKNPTYSFKFKAPNEVFVDMMNEEGELSGGKVVLDNVDFALNLPYPDEIVRVNIYSVEDKKIATFDIAEERENYLLRYGLAAIIIVITLLIAVFLIMRSKKK